MPPPQQPVCPRRRDLGLSCRHREAPQLLNAVAVEGLVLGLVLHWSFTGHFGIIWAPRALSPLGAC